jgi:hypothetical protein
MNQEITNYINSAPENQKELMIKVRHILHHAVPGVVESYKWNRPVFGTSKDFAYLLTTKAHVNLGFYNYQKLVDEKKLLEGTGKDMRHIKLKTVADIDEKLLTEWFRTLSK